jgi:hypothetical protein
MSENGLAEIISDVEDGREWDLSFLDLSREQWEFVFSYCEPRVKLLAARCTLIVLSPGIS